MKIIFTILLFLSSFLTAEGHIRINQLGYLSDEPKRAVLGSEQDLRGQNYLIRNLTSGQVAFSGKVGASISTAGPDTPFNFNHDIYFSSVQLNGIYRIELQNGETSHIFRISNAVYRDVIDSLLFFLKAARCGDTNPMLHAPCHLHDATNTELNLTGGWHDAGDFLKFTRQEAYTTYLLLLSFDVQQAQNAPFFSDKNRNGIADVLDEAKIGLDYLEKCYPDNGTFVHQVGDMEADHNQPFMLPENDRLAKTNRPALFGFDRNQLAKYAYTMALASKVFGGLAGYADKSRTYLTLSKRAYEKARITGSGHYDKLCLTAVELYRATNEDHYLTEAKKINDRLFKSDWGNYSDNTNLAHARLAPFYPSAVRKLQNSVTDFLLASQNNLFGFNVKYIWGSLYVALSSASSAWLYQITSQNNAYADLPRRIKDYTLGMNPWGVCFIAGLGTVYPKNIHNRLAYTLKNMGVLAEGTIKGAVAEGPISRTDWQEKWRRLVPDKEDIYAHFQTSECLYHDHVGDYVTNEPCIYGTAEAILFFSFYLRYLTDSNLSITNTSQNLRFFR